MNSKSTLDNNNSIDKSVLPFIITVTLLLGIILGGIGISIIKTPAINSNSLYSSSTQADSSNFSINSPAIDSDYFNSVYQLIQQKYIGNIPDKTQLTYGTLKGLLASLGNEYNYFLTPDEAKQYLNNENPNFEGIGVTLKFTNGNTAIETTLPNYPGQKAGLEPGDIILEVNSEKVTGQLPNAIAIKIKGPKGTSVTLKVQRNSQILNFTITREKINLDNITFNNLGNGIIKINIIQFLDTSVQDLDSKWDDTVKKIIALNIPIKGIIVDLRNNPGGYVYSVRYILEDFLKEGQTIMSEQSKNANETTYTVSRVGRFTNVPVVVLVNEGSASASEIFAAAIQDNQRGKVVGKPTVGKGVEQEVENLKDGSVLFIVYQKWLTAGGKNIDKQHPIKPDFDLAFTEDDIRNGVDPQLEKAKNVLSQ